ncbi:DUF448 domain-containing protein [Deferribacter autotrophicus]|uniref:DUF448 domain-containing protein n=1 Tax=Deferribacter autotrophicus TaxID=500465 RepID=A0A5A8F2N0_9BACT|nr:DUF448 domain-containing protein [Deferribacter autotrophicus]KAA0258063.1 DUF448 domain-containing protein [Deferribacter autotrophicus]
MGSKAIRTCIACNTEKYKDELLRFVIVDGQLVFDLKQKLEGRGCYLCFSKECFKKSTKKRLFQKHLKSNILEDISFFALCKNVRETYKRYIYTLLRVNIISKNIVEGIFKVKEALKEEKAFLCLFPSDVSKNSKDKLTNLIIRKKVPFYMLDDKKTVAINIHRPIRGAYAVLDKKLANVMIEKLEKIKQIKKWI